MTEFSRRESNNPQIDFLCLQLSLHSFFSRIVDQYKDLRAAKLENEGKLEKEVVDRAKERAGWERHQEKAKAETEEKKKQAGGRSSGKGGERLPQPIPYCGSGEGTRCLEAPPRENQSRDKGKEKTGGSGDRPWQSGKRVAFPEGDQTTRSSVSSVRNTVWKVNPSPTPRIPRPTPKVHSSLAGISLARLLLLSPVLKCRPKVWAYFEKLAHGKVERMEKESFFPEGIEQSTVRFPLPATQVAGRGGESQRGNARETPAIQPPTREELYRTDFVANITETLVVRSFILRMININIATGSIPAAAVKNPFFCPPMTMPAAASRIRGYGILRKARRWPHGKESQAVGR
ncbi:hypothetical protein K402DRAFT_390842 [Aulographum hederae CBS 113979]|uniref:Uncharacterized protein n=1 Tax=Aulographum hederae CBS 113979 TaxID=1176131 RepID=A0A6G1H8C2_9PEZI|nr:hypothetical protein K402DRAFT_390842 [Aulographum hederae CBS 113979]